MTWRIILDRLIEIEATNNESADQLVHWFDATEMTDGERTRYLNTEILKRSSDFIRMIVSLGYTVDLTLERMFFHVNRRIHSDLLKEFEQLFGGDQHQRRENDVRQIDEYV